MGRIAAQLSPGSVNAPYLQANIEGRRDRFTRTGPDQVAILPLTPPASHWLQCAVIWDPDRGAFHTTQEGADELVELAGARERKRGRATRGVAGGRISSRMHGEFLRLLFLQAHRETTAHFIATGLPSQQNRSDNAFRFKRAAFYMGLKSKVGLVAAKASALRINLNIQEIGRAHV